MFVLDAIDTSRFTWYGRITERFFWVRVGNDTDDDISLVTQVIHGKSGSVSNPFHVGYVLEAKHTINFYIAEVSRHGWQIGDTIGWTIDDGVLNVALVTTDQY